MKKRSLSIFLISVLVFTIGWNVWNIFFRQYGTDEFDNDFWNEFDAAYIVDSFDKLQATGVFSYHDSDTIKYPEKLLRWPINSKLMCSPVCVSIEKNSSQYNNENTSHIIRWETTQSLAEFTSIPDELREFKYLYTFYFMVPDGQIWYTQAGNSRKECMHEARKNLLWLMRLV